jgi:ABC-type glycerol-3-phosphate transport system permease component
MTGARFGKRRGSLGPSNAWMLAGVTFVIVVLVNLPIITMFLNSLRSTAEILSGESLIPTNPTLANYAYVLERSKFGQFFLNSVVMAGGATVMSIIAAAFAGYALSRFRFRLIQAYGGALYLIQMFPVILALIPLFVLFSTLHLINTYVSVIVLYTAGALPFATWMFKAFFDGIPRELEESAEIDGASRFQAFVHVVLPLAAPATAAIAIFSFLFAYNEYLVASVLLRGEELFTIPVGIRTFMQQYSSDWGSLMAASTMAMIPTFVLFLLVQRYVMYGAIGSGVKG